MSLFDLVKRETSGLTTRSLTTLPEIQVSLDQAVEGLEVGIGQR